MENEFILKIKSSPEFLPQVEDFVLEKIKNLNLPKEKIDSLSLAVAEAASNCIIHGNKFDDNKSVVITVKICKDELRIIFKDEGKGFDPKIVPDPTIPENILKESGRGIHIMRTFLDDLKFNFTETGTETILILKI